MFKVAGTTVTLKRDGLKKLVTICIPEGCLDSMDNEQIVELFRFIAVLETKLREAIPKDWKVIS